MSLGLSHPLRAPQVRAPFGRWPPGPGTSSAKAGSAPEGRWSGVVGCGSHIVQVVAVEGAGGTRRLARSTHLCSSLGH